MALMVRRILGAEPFDVGALPASSKVGPRPLPLPSSVWSQARPGLPLRSTCSQGPRVTWPTSCLCFGSRENAPHQPWKPPCPTLPMFPPSGRKHAGPAYTRQVSLGSRPSMLPCRALDAPVRRLARPESQCHLPPNLRQPGATLRWPPWTSSALQISFPSCTGRGPRTTAASTKSSVRDGTRVSDGPVLPRRLKIFRHRSSTTSRMDRTLVK